MAELEILLEPSEQFTHREQFPKTGHQTVEGRESAGREGEDERKGGGEISRQKKEKERKRRESRR